MRALLRPRAGPGVDDVGFPLRTLDALAERVAIDRTRVYATGLSNGSMMAQRLAPTPRTASPPSRRSRPRWPSRGSRRHAAMPVMHVHS